MILAPAVRDGQAPVASERQRRNLWAWGELTTFPLGGVDEPDHVLHDRSVEPGFDQLGPVLGSLDIAVEDGIEQLIGWQRVLVDLTRAQLGRRRLTDG